MNKKKNVWKQKEKWNMPWKKAKKTEKFFVEFRFLETQCGQKKKKTNETFKLLACSKKDNFRRILVKQSKFSLIYLIAQRFRVENEKGG